jgi:hypothetical protein
MNDIERYDFWHREMDQLSLAVELKLMYIKQLKELERQRVDFITYGNEFSSLAYLDKLIDGYLVQLEFVNKIINKELHSELTSSH